MDDVSFTLESENLCLEESGCAMLTVRGKWVCDVDLEDSIANSQRIAKKS